MTIRIIDPAALPTPGRVGPGMLLILAPHTHHRIVARTAGRATVADHPSRKDFL